MFLKSLSFTNFRNLKKNALTFHSQYNFFQGANAQGKTNLLEAIYYLTSAKSFRTMKISNLITFSQDFFFLKGISLKKEQEEILEVSFKLNSGRKHRYNHVFLKKGEYPWGIIPTLSFCRKDLKLSEEESSFRRQFLDQEISFLSKIYFSHLTRYNRTLKQRNAALKNYNLEAVRLWDNTLAVSWAILIQKKKEFIDTLNVLARLTYRQLTLSKEEMAVNYLNPLKDIPASEITEQYLELLKGSLEKEKRIGYTTFGPHRDDLEILINQKDIRKYGSSGQHKSAILSLKLALIEIIRKETGFYPILLLDDVFSEFDQTRSISLMEILKKKKLQVFFTGNQVPPYLETHFKDKTAFFQVSDGVIQHGI